MLQELCRLARREQLIGDPAFEVKPIAWIIELKADGTMIGEFSGTHLPLPAPEGKKIPKKPKEQAKKFLIPRQFVPESGGTRTSGDYAYFLVDKSDYVLGCGLGAKAGIPPEGKLKARHQLFIEKVREAFVATKEPRLEAVLKFLESVHEKGLPVDLPEKAAAGDQFAFVVRPDFDEFVHDAPSVQAYWRQICQSSNEGEENDWTCLITGGAMGAPALFPMVKRVPGGQALTGLVSFNAPAFESYGWKSNANAPVSSDAAQAAATALNRLLDPAFQRQDGVVLQKRHIRLSPDAVVCFWARDAAGDSIADELNAALQADPSGKAGELWRAAWRGKQPPKLDETKFYAVTLSGAQGRAMIRDWYETTVGVVQKSLAVYFGELLLPPNTFPPKAKPLPPQYGLRTIQESLTASGKADDLPSKYAVELFAASIDQRRRYPSALLPLALERQRAEIGRKDWIDSFRRDARTALIKAILIRNHDKTLMNAMNYSDKEPAYLLGCLFACIERMQYLALGEVNATIANRYFAAASTTPHWIFAQLTRDLNTHYFKKAKRQKPGQARYVYNLIGEISPLLSDGKSPPFPTQLNPVQQGLFMVGYHSQKHDFLPKNSSADGVIEPSPEEGLEKTLP